MQKLAVLGSDFGAIQHPTFMEFVMTEDYALLISYRGLDYVEDVFDDYDADIVELAVRLEW